MWNQDKRPKWHKGRRGTAGRKKESRGGERKEEGSGEDVQNTSCARKKMSGKLLCAQDERISSHIEMDMKI